MRYQSTDVRQISIMFRKNSHILFLFISNDFFSSSTLSKKLFPDAFLLGLPTLKGLERPWLELILGIGEDGGLGFITGLGFGCLDPKSRLSSLANPFLSTKEAMKNN